MVSLQDITSNCQYGERGLGLSEAFTRGLTAAAELGAQPQISLVTDIGCASAWVCVLSIAGKDALGSFGLGKGDALNARVGALYESLEHYLSDASSLRHSDVLLRSSHELLAGAFGADSASIVLADQEDATMGCLRYESLIPTLADECLPIALSTPSYVDSPEIRTAVGDDYKYDQLARYCSTSGWASGSSNVDATLHALNELIERDAFSLFLVEQFLRTCPPALALLDRSSIDESLAALWHAAETAIGFEICVLDITSEIQVPSYLAYAMRPSGGDPRLRGAGTSISPRYAVQRALTEILQAFFAIKEGVLPSFGAGYQPEKQVDAYPAFKAALTMDLRDRIQRGHLVPISDTKPPPSPSGHLMLILKRLSMCGYVPYRYIRYASPNLSVVNVFVPGLERFFLVQTGNLVLPTPRTRDSLRRDAR